MDNELNSISTPQVPTPPVPPAPQPDTFAAPQQPQSGAIPYGDTPEQSQTPPQNPFGGSAA
jgi:hypothetical protein